MAFKRSMVSLALAGSVAAAMMTAWPMVSAQAHPEPSLAPMSWELDFKSSPPERIVVDGKTYWYIRYTVTNNTGKDILFTPEFELTTDTGQVITDSKDVPHTVFEKIKETYNSPLLLSPYEVFGKMEQGPDNARDSVAIFANLDSDTREVHIFISGLSGETQQVTDPLTKKPVILHKTLGLDYDLPGEQVGIAPQPKLKSKTWEMK